MPSYADSKLDLMLAMGDRRRVLSEATDQARSATGASGWAGGYDPIDNDYGYRRAGRLGPREVPERTREQARMDSIVAGRANPIGKAIIDTYVAFCVGDSGLTLQCSSDVVRPVVETFWNDHRNRLVAGMERMFRTWMVMGEQLQEMMVGELTGRCRRSPIDPTRIRSVELLGGNPLWPAAVIIGGPGEVAQALTVIDVDDERGLRQGEVFFWPGFQMLESDTRGVPFLMPVLDWLDSYDNVLSNLIDRTALARYLVWDVTVTGDGKKVDDMIADLSRRSAPRSGTVNVHNDKVTWEPKTATAGAFEDIATAQSMMTQLAAGAGMTKHWLAEPDNANRATSLTMAEPVRRRLGSVQNEFLAYLQEMPRFAVDQAVAFGALPAFVEVGGEGGTTRIMAAADTVTITGPEIAAADAELTANVLVNLSQALEGMIAAGVLSVPAAKIAAQKAWEDYVGVPWKAELDAPDGSRVADVADLVDRAGASVPGIAA